MENDEQIRDEPDEGLDGEIAVCGLMRLHAGASQQEKYFLLFLKSRSRNI